MLTYLPASNLLTATGQLIADRTLFGATVGAALALGLVLDRAPRYARSRAGARRVLAIGPQHALASARYADAWSSHRTLWERLVEASPTEYRGYQLLGIDARERGDTARALPLLARAFAMEPRDAARAVRVRAGAVRHRPLRARRRRCWRRSFATATCAASRSFVAMYLDAVGRARGAEAVVTAGTPLLRGEAASTARCTSARRTSSSADRPRPTPCMAIGLRAAPSDSLLLARRASAGAARSRRASLPRMSVVEAVRWSADGGAVDIIDQRALPGALVRRELRTADDVCDAIATLAVRGAPAIGVAGAMGLVVALAPHARATTATLSRPRVDELGDAHRARAARPR